MDDLYALVCDLAVFEGKDLETLPVTRANLEKYGFGNTPYFHVEFAENQNGLVGYALYSYVYLEHQGTPYLYVDDLYVKPTERGICQCPPSWGPKWATDEPGNVERKS